MRSLQLSSSPSPVLSLQEGIDAHLAGQLDQAAQVYQAVLADDPINATALHYYGIYLHQSGQHDEALEKLMLSSALESDNAAWHNDLGNVFFALGRDDEAAASYEDALQVTPGDPALWNNLGAVQVRAGRDDDAMISFKRAVELDVNHVPALLQLGALFEAAGDKMQASHYQCRAYVLPPLEGKSKEMLGISYYFLGRLADAAGAYRGWLEEEPGNPVAAHMLAACSQVDVPARASDGYLAFHFDRYADTFDSNLLDSLGYRGPALIGMGLAHVGPPQRRFDAIDIGCGTGLCGAFIAPFAHTITGIDLAGKMLQKAADTGHYARLEQAEIGAYLAGCPASCELLTAADTMIYFGQLESVFGSIAGALRDGGYFIFTIEVVTAADSAPSGFFLHPSGRYRHARHYVHDCLARYGMAVLHESEEVLRQEIRQPVAGMLFVAQKLPAQETASRSA